MSIAKETLELSSLDHLIEKQEWDNVWKEVIRLLKVQVADGYLEADTNQAEAQKIKEFYIDFGSRILILLRTFAVPISDEIYDELIHEHRKVHAVLGIVQWEKTDKIIKEFKLLQSYRKNPNHTKRLLLLLNLKTKFDLPTILKNADIRYAGPAFLSYLSTRNVFDKQSYKNKVALLKLGAFLNKWDVSPAHLLGLARPYILCSYENAEHKHDIKRYINKCYERTMKSFMRQGKLSSKQKSLSGVSVRSGSKKTRL